MPLKRGEIHSRERAKQLRDFSGLLYGKITATDIDGLIEYHDKGYIFIETKLLGTSVGFGQQLALQRLADDLTEGRKPTICIIADHEVNDPSQDIDVANTRVREYRWQKQWHTPKTISTTKSLVDFFISNHLNKSR